MNKMNEVGYTAGAGKCVVRSLYPYVVRAIDEVFQLNDLQLTFKHWKQLDANSQNYYRQHPTIRAKIVELSEQDVSFSQFNKLEG